MNVTQIYNDLVSDQDNPVKLQYADDSMFNPPEPACLRMVNAMNPWSIRKKEFEYLYNTIINKNLKVGYDIATAFGVSSLAAGMGMKQTGGKVVTMDGYIEEFTQNARGYTDITDFKNPNAAGWRCVNYLINKYELKDHLFAEVGWSPTNTIECISKHVDLKTDKLDFVFIDAGHWTDAIIKDIDVIKDHMKDGCHIFIHDTHWFDDRFVPYLKATFGKSYDLILTYPDGWNLGLLVK
jgi:predicted O-methyltransferase YrrM